MTTLIHGILMGGTISFLHQATGEKVKNKAPQTWDLVAFQANHLFVILGAFFSQAKLSLDLLSLTAQGVFLVTPLVVLHGILFRGNGISNKEAKIAKKCSKAYLIASAVSSVALLCLGCSSFALTTLAWIGLTVAEQRKMFSPSTVQKLKYARTGAAALGAIGYGFWIFSQANILDKVVFVAICLFSAASQIKKPQEEPSYQRNEGFNSSQPLVSPSSKGTSVLSDELQKKRRSSTPITMPEPSAPAAEDSNPPGGLVFPLGGDQPSEPPIPSTPPNSSMGAVVGSSRPTSASPKPSAVFSDLSSLDTGIDSAAPPTEKRERRQFSARVSSSHDVKWDSGSYQRQPTTVNLVFSNLPQLSALSHPQPFSTPPYSLTTHVSPQSASAAAAPAPNQTPPSQPSTSNSLAVSPSIISNIGSFLSPPPPFIPQTASPSPTPKPQPSSLLSQIAGWLSPKPPLRY